MQRTEDWRKGTETTVREGLEIMDWTEEQAAWSAGKAEKFKPGAEVDGREAGLWQRIWIGGGGRAVRSRKGISYSVFCTRNMNYITGKLRDISQMMLLLGEPRQSRVQGTRGEICQDP